MATHEHAGADVREPAPGPEPVRGPVGHQTLTAAFPERVAQSGHELEVFYEGDGMLAPQVDGAARGIYASGRVPFDLPEETWGA